MSRNGALLEVMDVQKEFGGVRAVSSASLSVGAGEIVGLIGPNGSGKSTLLNVISGVYPPDRGSILFDGHQIATAPPFRIAKMGMGRTFQLPRLLRDDTALANVVVGAHNAGNHGFLAALAGKPITGAEEQRLLANARRALRFAGLEHRANVAARQLTGGETRQLELARAIACEVRLLLLDEPAAGLNTSETEMLEERFARLRDRGVALLLVDHDMRLIMRVAARVVVLNHGEVIATGSPEEVQSDAGVIEAYLGRKARRANRRSGGNG